MVILENRVGMITLYSNSWSELRHTRSATEVSLLRYHIYPSQGLHMCVIICPVTLQYDWHSNAVLLLFSVDQSI